MPYVSFSLKYRPRRFEDVVGQEHVSRTLMNAVRTGRVAHAYLFSGPRGTGKTSSARILAKALNCVHGPTPEPCGECDLCRAVETGRAMDVIEIDAASNRGIDEIRDLREKVKYSPAEMRCKVYILDEVHMLTTEAFNALLKTLEEPPPHSFFILATTEPHRVPPTIMSRCQRFDFRPIPLAKIVSALQAIAVAEGVQADEGALQVIARAADGAMRDAESIFDQVVAFTEGPITVEVVNAMLGVTEADSLSALVDVIARGDTAAAFSLLDDLLAAGKDAGQLLADLTAYLRDLLRLALGTDPPVWRLAGEDGPAIMRQQAQSLGSERLIEAVRALAQAQGELRTASNHALLLELTLAKLCQPPAPPIAQAAPGSMPARPQRTGATSSAAPGPVPSAPLPPPQPVVAGEVTLQVVADHWTAVPLELKRMKRVPVAAIVQEAMPTALTNGVLTLSFPPQFPFHHQQVSGPYRELVEQALERVFGAKLSVQCRLAQADESQAEQAPSVEVPESAPAQPCAGEPAPPTPADETPPADGVPQEPPEEPQTPSAVDRATQQTLSLFEGSRILGDGDT